MPAPQPVTIANELFDQMHPLLLKDDVPDPFTLRSLARRAEQLASAEPAEASIVKSGIAALEWNIEDVRHWAHNAVRLEPTVDYLMNATVSLRFVNDPFSEIPLLQSGRKTAPMDSKVASELIGALMCAGRIEEALAVYSEARADGLEVDSTVTAPEELLAALHLLEVSPERLEREARAALTVLTANRRRVRGLNAEIDKDPDGGSLAVVLSYSFLGSIADEISLERQIAEILGDSADWDPCTLAIQFQGVDLVDFTE